MKTYHLKDLLKKDVLIIEWQDDYEIVGRIIFGKSNQKGVLENIFNLDGYTLLGKPDEIKEDEAKELVEETEMGVKLNSKKYKYRAYDSQLGYATATESLLSALESEIYWENPYGKEPIKNLQSSTFGGEKTIIHRNPMNILWHEAESRTFDKKRVKIFVKN
jgi:hypothetical protein